MICHSLVFRLFATNQINLVEYFSSHFFLHPYDDWLTVNWFAKICQIREFVTHLFFLDFLQRIKITEYSI